MHVLRQMVEVMLRTPRWYAEMLVTIWSMCRGKRRILVWQLVEFSKLFWLPVVETLPVCHQNTRQQADKRC